MLNELIKAVIIFFLASILMRMFSAIRVRGVASFRLYVVYSIIYVASLLLFVFVFTFLAVGSNIVFFYIFFIFLGIMYLCFLYFYTQISVKIFKQLKLPWTPLFIFSPLTATVLASFSGGEKITMVINDYEEAIPYQKYVTKLKKTMECTFINWFYTELIIDDFSFSILNENNSYYLSCSKKKFEKKFEKNLYFLSNFKEGSITPNSDKKRISFHISQKEMLKMFKDFSAIVIKGDKLLFNNTPLFIRNEDFSFGVMYNRRQTLEFDFLDYEKVPSIYYNHIIVDQPNLLKLLEAAIIK
ncbi:MAG: hypothetical protein ACRC4W_01250 [Treponemataceae bacterium]